MVYGEQILQKGPQSWQNKWYQEKARLTFTILRRTKGKNECQFLVKGITKKEELPIININATYTAKKLIKPLKETNKSTLSTEVLTNSPQKWNEHEKWSETVKIWIDKVKLLEQYRTLNRKYLFFKHTNIKKQIIY